MIFTSDSKISSGRWDWWNEREDDSTSGSKSWQPLTAEEEARVIKIPTQQRVRLPSLDWKRRSNNRTASSESMNKEARKKMPKPRYSQSDAIVALKAMTEHYGHIPMVAEVRYYRGEHAMAYVTMLKYLGPHCEWNKYLTIADIPSELDQDTHEEPEDNHGSVQGDAACLKPADTPEPANELMPSSVPEEKGTELPVLSTETPVPVGTAELADTPSLSSEALLAAILSSGALELKPDFSGLNPATLLAAMLISGTFEFIRLVGGQNYTARFSPVPEPSGGGVIYRSRLLLPLSYTNNPISPNLGLGILYKYPLKSAIIMLWKRPSKTNMQRMTELSLIKQPIHAIFRMNIKGCRMNKFLMN